MAVDSCSLHKLGLIGGEISLTLTAAARPTSAAACHLKWRCCNFRQQRANTLSINYMVECAVVQQTHTVNTYVSCRPSLHSNPQHSNTCLLRSTSPEEGCFHGNQAAAFDDGSHEMTPTDNAGSSEPPRGRMDGWAGGWRWWGLSERNYGERESERQLFPAETESHSHSSLFPAGAVYLAAKQAATGTPWTRWGGSQPHQGRPDSRASCWYVCHKKKKKKKVSSNFCALAVRVREMFEERLMRHHLLPSFIYFFKQMSVKASEYFPPLLCVLCSAIVWQWRYSPYFPLQLSVSAFWPSFHIRALVMCGRSCCSRSKLFVVRSDCYSSPLCNILE